MKAKDLQIGDRVAYGGKLVTVTDIRRTSLHLLVDYASSAATGTLMLKPTDDVRELR